MPRKTPARSQQIEMLDKKMRNNDVGRSSAIVFFRKTTVLTFENHVKKVQYKDVAPKGVREMLAKKQGIDVFVEKLLNKNAVQDPNKKLLSKN